MRQLIGLVVAAALAGCLTTTKKRELKVFRTSDPQITWVLLVDYKHVDGLTTDVIDEAHSLYICVRTEGGGSPACLAARWDDPRIPPNVLDARNTGQ